MTFKNPLASPALRAFRSFMDGWSFFHIPIAGSLVIAAFAGVIPDLQLSNLTLGLTLFGLMAPFTMVLFAPCYALMRRRPGANLWLYPALYAMFAATASLLGNNGPYGPFIAILAAGGAFEVARFAMVLEANTLRNLSDGERGSARYAQQHPINKIDARTIGKIHHNNAGEAS